MILDIAPTEVQRDNKTSALDRATSESSPGFLSPHAVPALQRAAGNAAVASALAQQSPMAPVVQRWPPTLPAGAFGSFEVGLPSFVTAARAVGGETALALDAWLARAALAGRASLIAAGSAVVLTAAASGGAVILYTRSQPRTGMGELPPELRPRRRSEQGLPGPAESNPPPDPGPDVSGVRRILPPPRPPGQWPPLVPVLLAVATAMSQSGNPTQGRHSTMGPGINAAPSPSTRRRPQSGPTPYPAPATGRGRRRNDPNRCPTGTRPFVASQLLDEVVTLMQGMRVFGPFVANRLCNAAVIAIVDSANCERIRVSATYNNRITPRQRHAEQQCMQQLGQLLAVTRASTPGPLRMYVAVKSAPCPPNRENCWEDLIAFAAANQLAYVPRPPMLQFFDASFRVRREERSEARSALV